MNDSETLLANAIIDEKQAQAAEVEKERRAAHRTRRLVRNESDEMSIKEFKKLVKFDSQPKCGQDMLKCSACKKSMSIKKWVRLATKEVITCPGCGATAKVGTKVKVVFKEPSRFKIESAVVDKNKASVETRADGTRLIKETIDVKASAVTKKD